MGQQLYRGVISSLKDSFGKIEREDQFKETFFHFTEYNNHGNNKERSSISNGGGSDAVVAQKELRLGLNVEFEIQDKYGKEIACNIRKLPDRTVSFDELSANVFVGRIIQPPQPLVANSATNSAETTHDIGISVGRLIFDYNDDSLVELKFTDRDRIELGGEYTLLEGDFVQFRIATDKRSIANSYANNANANAVTRRATQISLIEEHSLKANAGNTKEDRQTG